MTGQFVRLTVLCLLVFIAAPVYLAAQPQSEGPRGGAPGGGAGAGAIERAGGGGGGGGGGDMGGGSSVPAAVGGMGGSGSGGGMAPPSPTPWSRRDAGFEGGPRRSEEGRPAHEGPPPYSRPRGDNPVIGSAVPRGDAPPRPDRGSGIVTVPFGYSGGLYDPYYRRYYSPYGYGAFGLGYFYYDPLWWSYPSGYWYGYPSYSSSYGYDQGAVRLKIKPANAEVLLDGYFVGRVDDFDGIFQRLRLDYGPHRVEVRAPGYEPLVFEIRAQPGRTITYRGELKPLP